MVYTPEDFARFAPRNANDMLLQIPGFTVDEGDDTEEETRGLGQASANVLLNGQRLASKSDSITDQLTRISAANVVRIELLDGASLDLPGLTGRIANIVTTSSGGISGQFGWSGEFRGRNSPSSPWGLSASISGTSGPFSFTLAAENTPRHEGVIGRNVVTFADGTVQNRTNSDQPGWQFRKISGSGRYDGPSGWYVSLSGTYLEEKFRTQEDEAWQPALTVLPASTLVISQSPEKKYELGAELGADIGPGRLKLIGLLSRLDDTLDRRFIFDAGTGDPATGSRFISEQIWTEKILRGEYSWKMLGGDWQLSGEGAFNGFDAQGTLLDLAPDGEFVEAPFPAGSGVVNEDRYEALLFHGRPITSNLTLQITGGGEYSRISQAGANALSRSFLRPKGSLGLAWTPGKGWDISLQLSRVVGQLDFEQFLGEVNVDDANTDAGNNQLRPEQSWEWQLEVARDMGAWGSATLTLFANRIEDYLTIIPLPGGGESTGNIASARENGVKFVSTLKLDPVGWRGAKIDLEAIYQSSRLVDPVTDAPRSFDEYEPYYIKAALRHDVPGTDWAWAVSSKHTEFRPAYRVAESELEYGIATDLRVTVEHKNIFGMTGSFTAANLLKSNKILRRYVYDGPRHISPLLFQEEQDRNIGQIFIVSLKGAF